MTSQASATVMTRTLHALRACGQSFSGIWERLSLYLPLAMMGLLAVGTYWLVRNTPAAYEAEAVRPVTHEVDYFMRRATVKTFDDTGRLKTEIFGTEARHFQDTETLEIDQARMRSTSTEGRLTTATANRALSNDAGSEVQLIGNAVVVREPMQNSDGKSKRYLEQSGFCCGKKLLGFVKPAAMQVTFPETEAADAEKTMRNTPVLAEYDAFATYTLAGVKGEQKTIEALSYDENRNPLIEIVLN